MQFPSSIAVLLLAVPAAVAFAQAANNDANKSRLGYINTLPSESAEAREARHKKIAERRSRTPILVHRGASRFAPENTLEAYAAAMDRGADGVEIDIRRTQDGVLYLMHDDTLDRTTEGSGKAKERTYYELLGCQMKGAPNERTRIPTLPAFIELARQRAMLLHLDVKEPGLQDEIERLFNEADIWDHVVEVNAGNAEWLRGHPRVKLLRYKGWLPQGGEKPDWPAIRKFLEQPGDMVFCKEDPALAVEALERKAPEAVPLPEHLWRRWSSE